MVPKMPNSADSGAWKIIANLFFTKYSANADAHKYTHTHPCEYTHDPTIMSTSERLCQRIFEIDEVTTGTSLSTGISPTAIELRSVRVIPNH